MHAHTHTDAKRFAIITAIFYVSFIHYEHQPAKWKVKRERPNIFCLSIKVGTVSTTIVGDLVPTQNTRRRK